MAKARAKKRSPSSSPRGAERRKVILGRRSGPEVPATTMRPAISFVTLVSRDVARSRGFYEAMGLVASERSREDLALFQMNGLVLAVATQSAASRELGGTSAKGGIACGSMMLSHNVGDGDGVITLLERARRAGGRVVKTASPNRWGGTSGCLEDPDGHRWEIVFNPRMTLDAKGNVYLEPPDVW